MEVAMWAFEDKRTKVKAGVSNMGSQLKAAKGMAQTRVRRPETPTLCCLLVTEVLSL